MPKQSTKGAAGNVGNKSSQPGKATAQELVINEETLRRLSKIQDELTRITNLASGVANEQAGRVDPKILLTICFRVVEVFGSSQKAQRWLETPIRSLNNRAPLEVLDSAAGRKLVLDTLGRIEHGIAG
jgi:putative toxin-antitoxin system antitoxin component (TIGR02293 family)